MLLHVYTVESAILLLNTMFFLKKKMHFILVPLCRVLIGDTIFASPTGDGTAILCGHLSHMKV